MVLPNSGEISNCYAIGDDLQSNAISPAQFVAAAECAPDNHEEPLSDDTNERLSRRSKHSERTFSVA